MLKSRRISELTQFSGSINGTELIFTQKGSVTRKVDLSAVYNSASLSLSASIMSSSFSSRITNDSSSFSSRITNITSSYSNTANYIPIRGSESEIFVSSIDLDVTNLNVTSSHKTGRVMWNQADYTAEIHTDVSGVKIQVGQESVVRVRNASGGTINNGKIVYISGSVDSSPEIFLADANVLSTVERTIGMATHDILNNSFGYITTFGLVRDLNTIGFPEGTKLYLGSSGNFTPSTSSLYNVQVGYSVREHNTQGTILVNIDKRGSQLNAQLENTVTSASLLNLIGADNATNIISGTLHSDRLPTTGVSAGTYNSVTVDTKGRVTAANNRTVSGTGMISVANGDGISGNPVISSTPISVTYAQLSTHITNSTLVQGSWYRITDYQTRWNVPNSSTKVTLEGPTEVLLVLATKNNTLAPIAYSETYPEDVIYYDAAITYSNFPPSDNFQGSTDGTPSSGAITGWITRRIDTKKNIDIAFDWRHITTRCYKYDAPAGVTSWNSGTTYSKNDVVITSNKLYFSLVDDNLNNATTDTSKWRPVSPYTELNTYFAASKTSLNLLKTTLTTSNAFVDRPIFCDSFTSTNGGTIQLTNVKNITISAGCHTFVFGGVTDCYVYSLDIGNYFYNNTIGTNFYNNTIGNSFQYNTIGNNFNNNTIGNSFNNNTIGNSFYSNTIGNNFYSNTIGNSFYYNTIGNSFNSNTIGIDFYYNTIGNNFYSNTIGNSFYYNTIGNSFYSNTIGTDFNANTIGIDFQSNTIGNSFYYNTIGTEFNSNTIGIDFYYNTIGNSFNNNTIGNSFYKNTAQDNFTSQDFTGATHVYNNYNTTLLNGTNAKWLTYYNDSGVLVSTSPSS